MNRYMARGIIVNNVLKAEQIILLVNLSRVNFRKYCHFLTSLVLNYSHEFNIIMKFVMEIISCLQTSCDRKVKIRMGRLNVFCDIVQVMINSGNGPRWDSNP